MNTSISQTRTESLAISGGRVVRRSKWPTWPAYDDATARVLIDALKSERWAISGPYRGAPTYERRFAEAFAAYNGVPYCIPVSSGSAALAVSLRALDVGYGDKVIVPGLTWVACATAVTSVGAIPVPADVDPNSLAMSVSALEARLSAGAAAVILVHPFCTVSNPVVALELCNRFGVPLIEDCSQAHGAKWAGQRVGTFGALGVFSMQQSKVLTSGEGGAVITSSKELASRVEQARADGREFSSVRSVGRLELVEVGAVQGRNHCLSEFQSAILLDRLPHLDSDNAIRRRNAVFLDRQLHAIGGINPLKPDSQCVPSYYSYVARLNTDEFGGRSVDEIARAISAELALHVAPIYQPLHLHRLFNATADPLMRPLREEVKSMFSCLSTQLPNCIEARRQCLSIPHFALLGDESDMIDIASAFQKVKRLSNQIPTQSSLDSSA